MNLGEGEKISVKENWASGEAVTPTLLNSVGSACNIVNTNLGLTEAITISNISFGGTGVDGALTVSSGTTNLTAGSWYQYSSIAITGTGKISLASNGAGLNGMILIKCSGNVTVSSSGSSIDLKGKGASGGAAGVVGTVGGAIGMTAGAGGISDRGIKSTSITSGKYPPVNYGSPSIVLNNKTGLMTYFMSPGSGGHGGADGGNGGAGGSSMINDGNDGVAGSTTGVAGGNGGGTLIMEIAGTFTFTGTIDVSGDDGSGGASKSGGGGGGSGMAFAIVGSTITDSGSKIANGGTGGSTGGRDGGDGSVNITSASAVLF